MIVCPLNAGECNRLAPARPKVAFVMSASSANQTDRGRVVVREAIEVVSTLGYEAIEGWKLVRHGDYFCSICRTMRGCPLGVAIVDGELSSRTLGNIFLEAGIMQGFGKPVVLLVDKRSNLPSDYVRHYSVFSNSRNYLTKFRGLLDDILRLSDDLYEDVGQFAFKAKDYEKAARYYQEAYLIRPKHRTLEAIESLASALNSAEIPDSYKRRLQEDIQHFLHKTRDSPIKGLRTARNPRTAAH